MKAKKPLLLAVLVLALLAVALILPAVASAKGKPENPGDNKAVNWVSSGENANNDFIEAPDWWVPTEEEPVWVPWQGGHSILAKEMPDGSLVGHMTISGIKPFPPYTLHSTTLLNFDPYTLDPIDVFTEDDDGIKTAEIVAVFDLGGLPVLAKFILTDGGEPPKSADLEEVWIGGESGWEPFGGGGSAPSISNIQIHMGE
jgi:hypothetical protein